MLSNINSYILINYKSLELEFKTNYKSSNHTKNLAILISQYTEKNVSDSIIFIKDTIINTTNPVEFIRAISKSKKKS